MPYGLYISAEGARAQTARMEVIANNLANVDTVGFKRDLAQFQARQAREIQQGLELPGLGSVNDVGGGVEVLASRTDFSAGPLDETGVPTDFALKRPGFFVVQREDEQLLTRAGNFMLDAEGVLRTQEHGYPVLSESGAPIVVDPVGEPWYLTPEGGIAQAGEVSFLALQVPAAPGDLARAGENLFRPLAPPVNLPSAERGSVVASGYLERSGVQATAEMMEMIETSRAFEANVNMIRNQDQLLGTLISRVLRT